MTALLFKNWGFPHKVFKGVQTFESKKIKETLQIQRFSHFLILPQTGIEPEFRSANLEKQEGSAHLLLSVIKSVSKSALCLRL